MPSMDGWQVVRAIKSDPELRRDPGGGRQRGGQRKSRPYSRRGGRAAKAGGARGTAGRAYSATSARQSRECSIVDDDEDARRVHGFASSRTKRRRSAPPPMDGRPLSVHGTIHARPDPCSDLMMPVMDGIAFLDAIRADPPLSAPAGGGHHGQGVDTRGVGTVAVRIPAGAEQGGGLRRRAQTAAGQNCCLLAESTGNGAIRHRDGSSRPPFRC